MEYKPRNIIIDWLNTIWESDLPSNAKLVACFLRKHMNSQNDMAWPSLGTIAGKTGLSKPTVIKNLRLLESEGWLTTQKGGVFDGKNTSSVYYARFPKLIEEAQKQAIDTIQGGGKGALPHKGDLLGVVKEVNHGGKGALPKVNKGNKQLELSNIYAHFDDFYSIYPKKKDKAKAQKIWDKLKIEKDSDIYYKIIYHVSNAYINTDHQYIPYPTTYLNGRRWEDEIDKPKEKLSTRDLPIEHHFTDTGWADGLN